MRAIPIHVYGLFDGERCEYVGVTVNLLEREVGHKKSLLKENPHWKMKVIETLTRSTLGKAEMRWIAHYKAIGQASRNISPGFRKAAKPHAGKACRRVICSNGRQFPSQAEAARYLGVCRKTVKSIISEYGGRHNRLIFAYAD